MFRVFAATVCGVSCALLISGCGSILIRPAVDNVKTVALVSVSMNRDFYDVKAPRTTSVSLESLKPLGHAVSKGTEIPGEINEQFAKEYEAMITHGAQVYSERLEGVGNWKWMPVADVLSSNAYKEFADSFAGKHSNRLIQAAATIKESEWYTARDMVRIPVESVAQSGKVIRVGGTTGPLADMHLTLGKLCKDLNVDAVAILVFDMAYKKPLISVSFIDNAPAIPSINATLVLVNKDGEIAVNSGPITKGQGKRFEGDKVGMLRQDYVQLDDKSVSSYDMAIDKSAEDMKQRLATAFGKIK